MGEHGAHPSQEPEMSESSTSPPSTLHFRGVDLTWTDNGSVEFVNVDEELEMVMASLADTPHSRARIMLGIRDAENRGLLKTQDDLRSALEALEGILSWTFEWPASWGPFDQERLDDARDFEYAKAVRCLPEAAKVIGLRTTRSRLRAALLRDRVPLARRRRQQPAPQPAAEP